MAQCAGFKSQPHYFLAEGGLSKSHHLLEALFLHKWGHIWLGL